MKTFKVSPHLALFAAFGVAWITITPAQAAETTERVKLIRFPGISNVIKAQSDASGAFHLVFEREDGPEWQLVKP